MLEGECKTCCYGDVCLGGCPNTRLTMNRSIYSENQYCAYRLAQIRTRTELARYCDTKQLLEAARTYVSSQKWQLAAMTLERALQLNGEDEAVLELYGFVCFALGNYTQAREANERILAKNPSNAYGQKGLGLSLHRLNQSERRLPHLIKATELAKAGDLDALHDLFVVYGELGRHDEALAVLQRAQERVAASVARP